MLFLKEMKSDETWMQVTDKAKFSKQITAKYLKNWRVGGGGGERSVLF